MKATHTHKYTRAKYIQLDTAARVTNPKFTGMSKPVLKVVMCECGHEVGKDLLHKMPERK